jgi:hypothetical protein
VPLVDICREQIFGAPLSQKRPLQAGPCCGASVVSDLFRDAAGINSLVPTIETIGQLLYLLCFSYLTCPRGRGDGDAIRIGARASVATPGLALF